MDKEFVWHFMNKEDLNKFGVKAACGLPTEKAGLSTCKKKWVTCKNCLRVIKSRKNRKWKVLMPSGEFAKASESFNAMVNSINKAIKERW